MNVQLWKAHLEWAEERRQKPYVDSVGKLSIGIGRNLDDRGLRDSEIDFLLDNDVAEVLAECAALPYWGLLNDARQIVIADMVFNLGLGRFLKFRKLAAALEVEDYETAADEMKASKWYGQVKRRAERLVAAMRSGRWTS
jgi:lysozyme